MSDVRVHVYVHISHTLTGAYHPSILVVGTVTQSPSWEDALVYVGLIACAYDVVQPDWTSSQAKCRKGDCRCSITEAKLPVGGDGWGGVMGGR